MTSRSTVHDNMNKPALEIMIPTGYVCTICWSICTVISIHMCVSTSGLNRLNFHYRSSEDVTNDRSLIDQMKTL